VIAGCIDITDVGADLNRVEGNFIGTNRSGAKLPTQPGLDLTSFGVLVGENTKDNFVGRQAGGAGNTIAFVSVGVGFRSFSTSVFSNSYHSVDDPISGNESPNVPAPTITSVAVSGGKTKVDVEFSAPSTRNVILELYLGPHGGRAEADIFDASMTATKSGHFQFDTPLTFEFTINGTFPNEFFSATATQELIDPFGTDLVQATSEFSHPVKAT
jgi:hypothetical protein